MSFIEINSEIGELEGVILHTPGVEIESMTPSNIQEALYSDLLNLNIASKEYSNFAGVLSKWTKTYQVKDLLAEVLTNKEVKSSLIDKILTAEKKEYLFPEFIEKSEQELARILIEGYKYREGVFNPLYNLFFTRDASSSVYDKVLIHSMSTDVRDRESFIMETIFKHYFSTETINPRVSEGAHTEGGDVLIAREDVLFIGNGCRTNKKGIEFLTKYYTARKEKQPLEYPNAGSTFKRPEGYFAGKLIEDAGLRGYSVGDAQVSEKHCGFVINKGNATATEIHTLMEQVKKKVMEQFGVELEPEVILLGE